MTASTLLLRLVLSIEQGTRGTIQTGNGKVDPARKFKCTTAALDNGDLLSFLCLKCTMYIVFICNSHSFIVGQPIKTTYSG